MDLRLLETFCGPARTPHPPHRLHVTQQRQARLLGRDSPVQCMADLRTAARPTRFKYSDAASTTEAGGVLGRYQRLRTIHNAHQVIPSSLRVSTPE